MKGHPYTDIVVPVHNALDTLRHCIDTVCRHTKAYRVIFVDDYSDGQTGEYFRGALRDHPDWLMVRTGKQKWFTRASNLGLRLTKTEKVVLLNSDCEVNTGWLDELYEVWAEAEAVSSDKIGLVGSIGHDPNLPRWVETRYDQPSSYVTGHCYLLDMAAMTDLSIRRNTPGWYFNERDPEQIHIGSDRIMCWDLNKAGYRTIGAYHVQVGHHGGKSWGHQLGSIPRRLEDVD